MLRTAFASLTAVGTCRLECRSDRFRSSLCHTNQLQSVSTDNVHDNIIVGVGSPVTRCSVTQVNIQGRLSHQLYETNPHSFNPSPPSLSLSHPPLPLPLPLLLSCPCLFLSSFSISLSLPFSQIQLGAAVSSPAGSSPAA